MADDDGQNAAGGRGKGRGRGGGRIQQGHVAMESDSEGEDEQAAAFAHLFCDINVATFPEPPESPRGSSCSAPRT